MSTKRYRLEKDLPYVRAGDFLIYDSVEEVYRINGTMYKFSRGIVEGDDGTWFSLIEDEPKEFQWTDALVRDHVIEFVKWTEGRQFVFSRQSGRWYKIYNEFLKEKGKIPFPYFTPANQPDLDEYGAFKSSHQSIKEEQGLPLPKDFQWTDELVLMLADLAHHNGYHKFNKKVTDLFDEVKKQAQQGGYRFSEWITNHVKKQPEERLRWRDRKKQKGLWKVGEMAEITLCNFVGEYKVNGKITSIDYVNGIATINYLNPVTTQSETQQFDFSSMRIPAQPEPKRDWEIVSFKDKYYAGGKFYTKSMDGKWRNDISSDSRTEEWLLNNQPIYSVKRLSDGEIFRLGDETSDGEICEFQILETIMYVGCASGFVANTFPLNTLQKAPFKSQPTKERTEVTFLSEFAGKCIEYKFWSTKKIPLDKFQQIGGLIESGLNDDIVFVYNQGNYQDIQCVTIKGEKFYSQKEVDEIEEAAFNSARECGYNIKERRSNFLYADFKGYKNKK